MGIDLDIESLEDKGEPLTPLYMIQCMLKKREEENITSQQFELFAKYFKPD